jgi:predicted amidophosphoribosyltransferase
MGYEERSHYRQGSALREHQVKQQLINEHKERERYLLVQQNARRQLSSNKQDDFLADLRLPAPSHDSGLGLGSGGSRAQKVLDKARAQQVEMERKEQRRQLENIYLSGGKLPPSSYDRESR